MTLDLKLIAKESKKKIIDGTFKLTYNTEHQIVGGGKISGSEEWLIKMWQATWNVNLYGLIRIPAVKIYRLTYMGEFSPHGCQLSNNWGDLNIMAQQLINLRPSEDRYKDKKGYQYLITLPFEERMKKAIDMMIEKGTKFCD